MSVIVESRGISERLMLPLRQVIGRTHMLRAVQAFLVGLIVVGVVWLGVVLPLGFFTGMALWGKIALAALAWIVLALVMIKLIFPALKRPPLRQAARMVDRAGNTQERITSALELAEEPDSPHKGSPQLIAALMGQAEAQAETVDPGDVTPSTKVTRCALLSLPVLAAWLLMLALYPDPMTNGLARVFRPWGVNPPAPTISLEIDPGDKELSQGETLEVNVAVLPPAGRKDVDVTRATIVSTFETGQRVTADLERTGPRTFRTRLENLQQPLTYAVTVDGVESKTYHVAVLPRPALLSADVTYTFPAYTGMGEKTDAAKDGNLSAVAGTQADILFHFTMDLTSESAMIVNTRNAAGLAVQRRMTLASAGDKTARVSLDLQGSGTYELELVGEKNLRNAAPITRSITVSRDAVPLAKIISPAESSLHIRPIDTAPVIWSASDDFLLTRVEIQLAIDDDAPTTETLVDAPIKSTGEKTYLLAIPKLLADARKPGAKKIYYQIKATDNAQPPQVGWSPKNVLELDAGVGSMQQEKDTQDHKALGEAIKKTAGDLEKDQKTIDQLRGRNGPLTAEETQKLSAARRDLENGAKTLSDAGEKARGTSFDLVANDAEKAADSVHTAATSAATAEGASGDAQKSQLKETADKIADARKKVDDLGNELEGRAQQRTAFNTAEDGAQRARDIADKMSKDPANREKYLEEQKALARDLEKLQGGDAMTRAAEQEAAKKNADLGKGVEKFASDQQELKKHADAEEAAANADKKIEDIQKDQSANKKNLHDFSDKNKDALKNAGVTPPDPPDQIERDLARKNPGEAAKGQENLADRLQKDADRLDQAADTAEKKAAASKDAADRAATDAKDAQKLRQRFEDVKIKIGNERRAGGGPTKPEDQDNQELKSIAGAVRKAAENQQPQSAAQRTTAANAKKEATEAERAAANGRTDESMQQLTSAMNDLQSGAESAKEQTQKAASSQPARNTRAAADDAKKIADQARALAQQSKDVQDALNKSASDKGNPGQTQAQQEKVAQGYEKAAADAKAAAQRDAPTAPKAAEAAKKASEDFSKAAEHQRAAAKADQQGRSADAQREQTAANDSASRAVSELTGEPQKNDTAGNPAAQQTAGTQKNAGTPQSSTPNAGGAEKSPGAGAAQATTQTDNTQQTASTQTAGQQSTASGQSGAPQPQTTAQSSGKPDDKTGAAQPEQNPTGAAANNNTGEKKDPAAQQAVRGENGPAQNVNGDADPKSVEAVKELAAARDAEARAIAAKDPKESAKAQQEAAEHLQQVSRIVADKNDLTGKNSSITPGHGSAGKAGSGTALPGGDKTAGASAGNGAEKKDPATAGAGGGMDLTAPKPVSAAPLPDSVQQMGINPSEWERLSPEMQAEVLSASQQKGPPAYREAIKNYYTMISRLKNE